MNFAQLLANYVHKNKIVLFDHKKLYVLLGNTISLSYCVKELCRHPQCPSDIKVKRFNSVTYVKELLTKTLAEIGVPYLEVEKVKAIKSLSKEYLLNNSVVPFLCPKSGILYFFSGTLKKIIPCSKELYKKFLDIDETYFVKMTHIVELNFNPELEPGIHEGLEGSAVPHTIVCHDFGPFIFKSKTTII